MTEAVVLSNILVPFGAAVVAAMAGPRWRSRFDPWVALLAVVGAVLTVVTVARLGVPVRIGLAGWRAPLGIELLADGLGVSMVAMTAVVGAATTLFALAGVNLMGLPPSGGFMAKWLLLRSALENGQWPVVAVIVVGSLLAAAYIFRVVEVAFSNKEVVTCRRQPTAWMRGTALALAVVSILLGTLSRAPLDFLMIGFPGGTP